MNTPSPAQPADPSRPDADPMIDEVREARRQVDEQHGGDLRKLAAALREGQQKSGRRIISGRPSPSKRAG